MNLLSKLFTRTITVFKWHVDNFSVILIKDMQLKHAWRRNIEETDSAMKNPSRPCAGPVRQTNPSCSQYPITVTS